MRKNQMFQWAGLSIVFFFFMFGGIGHFISTDFFVKIVPPYIPLPKEVVFLTGAVEIAGAMALLFSSYRARAGIVLIALTVAVTPANIHMWLNPQLFPNVPAEFLSIRLVLQILLIALIWFSTRDEPKTNKSLSASQLP